MNKEIPFIDVEIKQSHIDAGNRGSNQSCPLALAFRPRMAAHAKGDLVPREFRPDGNKEAFSPSCVWPDEAYAAVKAFDAGQLMQPTTFRVLHWENGKPRPTHAA